MKTHPYLRAYMAGIAVPTPFLLVAVTGFTIGRAIFNLPVALEHVIIFPMAVVPNLWGVWNMLRLALGTGDRWPIGVHGAVLPLLLMPLGLLLTYRSFSSCGGGGAASPDRVSASGPAMDRAASL